MTRVAFAGLVALACTAAVAAAATGSPTATRVGGDWARFGYDAARSSSGPARTGITAASVRRLKRQRVTLDGTVDSSPIYLRGIRVEGRRHDVFVVTTTYGKTLAVDAADGRVLWEFTPPGYARWAGTYRFTNATPIADPTRTFVFSVSPDGRIYKLALASGIEAGGAWPVSVTRLPEREKIAPALNFSRGLVLVGTGGYIGDEPPYQGHVVAIDARSGRIVNVWNSLCSDRRGLIVPSSCAASDSAIWARAGVVVDPSTGNLLVATGNGPWDGRTNWGDSVLMLSPDAGRLLQNWTPTDEHSLDTGDVDLGSTAPALLGNGLAAQSGKDGKLRLLDLRRLNGRGGAGAVKGGELQTLRTPSGGVFSAPAVWRSAGRTWLYVSDFGATAAYVLKGRRLAVAWRVSTAGTSPVVAGGLLYVYDPGGGLNVYAPTTGRRIARLAAGPGHWNSPIVTDGRIALPEGDANDHATTGVLDIWR